MVLRLWMSGDIINTVRNQLPRAIADELNIELQSDPFLLRAKVRFTDKRNRTYDCELELAREGSRLIACKVPEWFIARLCVEV